MNQMLAVESAQNHRIKSDNIYQTNMRKRAVFDIIPHTQYSQDIHYHKEDGDWTLNKLRLGEEIQSKYVNYEGRKNYFSRLKKSFIRWKQDEQPSIEKELKSTNNSEQNHFSENVIILCLLYQILNEIKLL